MVKEIKDKFGNVFTPGKLSDKIKALLRKKLDAHIEDVWTVYKPIKKIIEKFKLW